MQISDVHGRALEMNNFIFVDSPPIPLLKMMQKIRSVELGA
jgi:hypothetical protein